MDFKELANKAREAAENALKQAETKFNEVKANLDKDGDGVPDQLEGVMNQAKQATEQAKAKFEELKSNLDKDGDGVPDQLKHLSEQAQHAAEQARVKAEELAKAAQERLGKKS
ncbi:dolichyl-phosphate-mannose-protein mannosyltransferase [Meiothermus sp.]|uniref:dolichyl-phosphate-mannose-protein mannosyltransferase n=1 Tax=Meiothermus sp. TaxID=1955249 RepID=UPI00307DF273